MGKACFKIQTSTQSVCQSVNEYVYSSLMLITEPNAGHTMENKADQIPAFKSQQCCVRDNEQVSSEKNVIITLTRAVKGMGQETQMKSNLNQEAGLDQVSGETPCEWLTCR